MNTHTSTTDSIEELDKLFHPHSIPISSSISASPRLEKKRKRACLECTKSHSSCDGKRPCSRCILKKRTDFCVDVLKKKYIGQDRPVVLKPLIPKPLEKNVVYPTSFSLPCAYASKEDIKCHNCQKSTLNVPKDWMSKRTSLLNQDFIVNLEKSLDLPNCFGLSEMWLNSEMPLWMKSLNPMDSSSTLIQLHSQVEDLCCSITPNESFPTLESVILEYSQVIRLLPSPAAVWTLPDGFLKVSNASFTQVSSFEMIQHCIHPDSLDSFYEFILQCISNQQSTGQTVFINHKRATLQLSLRLTSSDPCIFGNFIITDSSDL